MKIWLTGWFEQNLGDDLFVKVITDRYPNARFYLYSKYNYKKICNNKNIRSIYKYDYLNIKKKVYNLLFKKNNEIFEMSKFDSNVLISGSYFMENENYNFFINKKVPYYIIGVNFGPYFTKKYFEDCYDLFSNAADVCFRDKYSYNMFKNIKTVRQESDIVFSLDISKYKNESEKIVFISVVDINKGGNKTIYLQEEYEKGIIAISKYFSEKGYSIYLVSFSSMEGDENVINNIINSSPNINYSKYLYNGNIDEILELMSKSEIVVGTRYHANILALLMGKRTIPISYSKKMLNVLKDMNFPNLYFDLNEKNGFEVKDELLDKNYKKINVDKEITSSQKQFKYLDKFILGGNNDSNK